MPLGGAAMDHGTWTRRELIKGSGVTMLAMTASGAPGVAVTAAAQDATQDGPEPGEQTRAQRLAWWRAARFGMFIHFGVYSTIQRHEWVMEEEAIPVAEYAPHAATFHPRAGSPRAWARLAKQAGMK